MCVCQGFWVGEGKRKAITMIKTKKVQGIVISILPMYTVKIYVYYTK
jgi:hypothetical protein